MASPTTIHALERGRAPANLPRSGRVLETANFDVVIPPPTPLHIGQRVKINALSVINEPDWEEGGRGTQTWYASTPADIEGRIVGIRALELAVTELIVLNEVKQSLVEHAYITVQHTNGATVSLGIWHRIMRTLLLPFLPHTRHVPVERNAVVIIDEEQPPI
ncbi:hypothetical protein VTO73DRAFT_7285 [Trametes versicolor]